MAADPTKTAGAQSIPFRITGKPEVGAKYIKIMVYGGYGSGKTTLAATAVDVEQMRDVLFIDVESGEMTLDDNPRVGHSELIDRIRVTNFEMVAHVQEFLKAHCAARDRNDEERLRILEARVRGVKPEDIETPKRYRTVIIDSLTEVNEYAMYSLLGLSTDMKLDIEKMDVAEWPEFRKNNQMMQLVVRAYRDLPMNVILVASSQYTQDEMKRKFFAPNLTGKLANQVQGFMDVVGYLVTGSVPEGGVEAARRLFVQPVKNFDAKNRRSQFRQAYFDNPSMRDIMDGLGMLKK